MPLPTSEKWGLLDYTFRASDAEVSATGARLLSDSEFNVDPMSFIQFPNVVIEDGYATFVASGNAEASIKDVSSLILSEEISGGIPENFTLEFEIFLTENLPLQASNVNNRIFVGATNAQGYSAGFIFSREGIHLASRPEDPVPMVLAGTKDLLFNSDGSLVDGVCIRAVISQDDGRLFMYASSSSGAYVSDKNITDAELYASVAAREASPLHTDSVIVYGSACSVAKQVELNLDLNPEDLVHQESIFSIGSLRLSGQKTYPIDRPTASAFGETQVVIGTATVLSGINSSDKMHRPLTYKWELDVVPEGSKAKLQGSSNSRCLIPVQVENPGPGDPATANALALVFQDPKSEHNSYKTVLSVGPVGSSLSMELDTNKKTLNIYLESTADGDSATTVTELASAFSDPLSAGYSLQISGGEDLSTGIIYPRVLSAFVSPSGVTNGHEIVHPGEHSFTRGVGSSVAKPVFIPDVPGTYMISLVVNNGLRDSAKSMVVLTATVTEQLLGHRPQSNYIFKYLPDFWKMVQDKEMLPSVWSAITQVISSELVSAWQNDYAKALKDISRRYQRRWLSYQCRVDVPEDVTTNLVYHDASEAGVAPDPLSVYPVLDGTHTKTCYVEGSESLHPFTEGFSVVYSAIGKPEVAEIVSVAYEEAHGRWKVDTRLQSFAEYQILGDRAGGYFVKDPDIISQTTPVTSKVFYDPTYTLSKVDGVTDRVRLKLQNGDVIVTKVVEHNPGGLKNTVRLDLPSSQDVNGIPREWEHLRKSAYTALRQSAYLEIGSSFMVSASFGTGDYAGISVIDPYTSLPVTITLPIIAFESNRVFLQWGDLIDALNVSADYNGVTDKNWSEQNLPELSIKLKYLARHNRTFPKDDLVSVPTMGASISNPLSKRENFDYVVSDNAVSLKSMISGVLNIEDGSVVTIHQDSIYHPGLNDIKDDLAGMEISDLHDAGIRNIVIEEGPAGTYPIIGAAKDIATGNLMLALSVQPNGHGKVTLDKVKFHIPIHSAQDPGPEQYWAEISYFDNSSTVEGNFGLFVGFPEELVKSYDEDLDYLSVIKSLWFAFLSGPHFENMKLGVQALFNLPYAEVAGQVTYINPPTSTEDGKIVMVDDRGRSYTYTYPANASIAINPSTGRTIRPFDIVSVKEEAALDDEKREQLEDSKVKAFTKLVDVVRIDDYVSDPDLVSRQLGGNTSWYVDDEGVTQYIDEPPTVVEKYHKFIVDVPLDVTKGTQVFPLVKTFLSEAKPAYTDFILLGSIRLSDQISLVEDLILKPTVILKDTPHTSPFWGLYDGMGKSYPKMLPVRDENGDQLLSPNTGEPLWVQDSVQQAVVPETREKLIWPHNKTTQKVAIVDNFAVEELAYLKHSFLDLVFHAAVDPVKDADDNIIVNPDGAFPDTDLTAADPMGGGLLYTNKSHIYGSYTEVWDGVSDWKELYLTDLGKQIVEAGDIGFYIKGSPWLYFAKVVGVSFTQDGFVGGPIGLRFTLGAFSGHGYPFNTKEMVSTEAIYFFGDGVIGGDIKDHLWGQEVTYWDFGDVKEKYESGYCEGVLDDYSGDASWNSKRRSLDMVNSLNSDIDVLSSKIWVPVTKDVTVPDALETEFITGEEIDIMCEGVLVSEHAEFQDSHVEFEGWEYTIWGDSPPVLIHYGAGSHPKIPFSVDSPQNEHPNSYMVLGFEAEYINRPTALSGEIHNNGTKSLMNYGHESRLDVISRVAGELQHKPGLDLSDITLVGRRSGAVANLAPTMDGALWPDRSNPEHAPYFMLETIWQTDKLIENGPKDTTDIIVTKYIPLGGMAVDEFQASSFNFSSMETSYLEKCFFHEKFIGLVLDSDKWEVNPNAPGDCGTKQSHPNFNAYVFDGGAANEPRRLQLKNPVKGPVVVQYVYEAISLGVLYLTYSTDNGNTWVAPINVHQHPDVFGEASATINVEGDILLRWGSDVHNGVGSNNWMITDIKISKVTQPTNPDPTNYPDPPALAGFVAGEHPGWGWGGNPLLHTKSVFDSANLRKVALEVQQHPWDPNIPMGKQLVPSFSPGFYSWQQPTNHWAGIAHVQLDPNGVITPNVSHPSSALISWGYKEVGKLTDVETDFWEFEAGAGNRALQNLHIGFKTRCAKEHHFTHGFTEFFIPPPKIKLIEPSSSAYDIRVGGFYFCNDDPTRTEVPTSDPLSFDGQIGGSYIFFRKSDSQEEYPVTDWVFETGTWAGRNIVPKGRLNDGTTTFVVGRDPDPNQPNDNGQRSDGHIYEINIPALQQGGEGYYDIIIRNYRPWKMHAADQTKRIKMDEVIVEKAYYYTPGGWGGISWGTDSWGGGESFPGMQQPNVQVNNP